MAVERTFPATMKHGSPGLGGKSVILLLTHVMNPGIAALLGDIKAACADEFDVFCLCDNTNGKFDRKRNAEGYVLFCMDDLKALPYPGKNTIEYKSEIRESNPHHKYFNFKPGSTDLPILHFFGKNSEYKHYWIVEYDVRFTGSWDGFFSFFANNDSDLLGTTLTRYPNIRDWHHWPSLDLLNGPIPEEQRLRGFFPVYRLSRRALETLDRRYRDGVRGHYECLVPTVLSQEGMTIEDIGGDGAFVDAGNINRFYYNSPTRNTLSPGSFVFRPVMDRPGQEPNKLWHPVKHVPVWRTVLRKAKKTLNRPRRKSRLVT
jgi:hypothetical protein